jgi:hypothetical protein
MPRVPAGALPALIVEISFLGNLNHARSQNEAQVTRSALPAAVRPDEEERQNQHLDQASAPRTQYHLAPAQGTAARTQRKADGVGQRGTPTKSHHPLICLPMQRPYFLCK